MRRGDVYVADLEPVRGSEANKTRPVVVVSNDAYNRTVERLGRGVVAVIPLTSNTGRPLPFQPLLPAGTAGLSVDSKSQPEQVRGVAVERLRRHVGTVPPDVMADLDRALRLHLAL